MSTSADRLPQYRSVLAVCAHPDDESFGLGGIIAAFRQQGASVDLLCFNRGESSTLGDTTSADELAALRAAELADAAAVLGLRDVRRLAHPDGALASVELAPLVAEVEREVASGAECLLVFDCDGITGHPDHRRATEAAVAAAERADVPVLAWAVEEAIATALNEELGTSFCGPPAHTSFHRPWETRPCSSLTPFA